MTRLEKAKEIFNNLVEKAKPSFVEPLFLIKEEILLSIYEDVFNENPTTEENDWLNDECRKISVYSNTEYF